MIKAVLFDFGGVLTESGKSGFISETVADLYNVNRKDVDIGDLHYALRRGKEDEQAFFDELNTRYGGQATKEMFLQKIHASFEPSPEVYKLAKTLREHGIRTGILSNVFAMNARELEKQGWYEGFDPIVLSCDEGFAKPEAALYEIALSKLDLRGEDVLFIDDQEKCMAPAEAHGMHTIIAKSPSQIVADTKALIRTLNKIEL